MQAQLTQLTKSRATLKPFDSSSKDSGYAYHMAPIIAQAAGKEDEAKQRVDDLVRDAEGQHVVEPTQDGAEDQTGALIEDDKLISPTTNFKAADVVTANGAARVDDFLCFGLIFRHPRLDSGSPSGSGSSSTLDQDFPCFHFRYFQPYVAYFCTYMDVIHIKMVCCYTLYVSELSFSALKLLTAITC